MTSTSSQFSKQEFMKDFQNLPGLGWDEFIQSIIDWTDEEKSYILLATSLDHLRISSMEDGPEKDTNYRVRHAVREKLIR